MDGTYQLCEPAKLLCRRSCRLWHAMHPFKSTGEGNGNWELVTSSRTSKKYYRFLLGRVSLSQGLNIGTGRPWNVGTIKQLTCLVIREDVIKCSPLEISGNLREENRNYLNFIYHLCSEENNWAYFGINHVMKYHLVRAITRIWVILHNKSLCKSTMRVQQIRLTV